METLTLLASQLTHKDEGYVEALDVFSVAALHSGGTESLNPKLWPCEDSVALAMLDDGSRVAAVADAHFGGHASEAYTREMAEIFDRLSHQKGPRQLQETVSQLDERHRSTRDTEDQSETTLLMASLRGRELLWINVGDSLLLFFPAAGGHLVLSDPEPVFLGDGREPRASQAWTRGVKHVRAGDVVLLATDGIEPEVSGLQLADVEQIMRRGGDLQTRVQALVDRACDPKQGGGRDNLGVVALEIHET